MKSIVSRKVFGFIIAFLLVIAGSVTPLAHAGSNNQVIYLNFKPDPTVEKPLTVYRVEYWADGQPKQTQMFSGQQADGYLNTNILAAGNPMNFRVYRTDTTSLQPGQSEKRVWESPAYSGVKPGNSIYTKWDVCSYSYKSGDTFNAAEGCKLAVSFTPDPNVPESEYNLWVWTDGAGGYSTPFTGKDAAGRLTAEVTVSAPNKKVNLIVRRSTAAKEWAWQTSDLKDIPVPGGIDIKTDSSFKLKPAENPNTLPKEVTVTVHYQRHDNKYDNWNLWTWIPGKDGSRVNFDGNHTATITHKDPNGIEKVGLIVRRSEPGNDWAEKNTPDDLFITKFPQGKAEVWIVQGDPKIYYSQADIPKPDSTNNCTELHSAEFNKKYYYEGELGAIYSPEKTTFRLWAPTAQAVEFVNYSQDGKVTAMTKGEKGTWEITFNGDQKGVEYRYRLHFDGGKINEAIDPYARAVTANSTRTVVIDTEKTVPHNWDGKRMPAFTSMKDAIIYEAHVRDLTIGPDNGITNKGKFLGLTEAGTKTKAGNLSGLDYLKSLGITHVQFLPVFDFGSVDEQGDISFNAQYNWGYDPQNYNVPEGSYATKPADPTSRILELKSMVETMHANDMRVIMDVVYNHVHKPEMSPLQQTVPNYYFRMDANCKFQDGTGVGNETASEQLMMRKYIVDSVTYWAKNYDIDGFRFDLMGIHDVETMKAVREALNKIDPSIVILGEGWKMGNHPAGVAAANQENAKKLPGISFFNDQYRDTVKGDNFELKHTGFISGANQVQRSWDLLNNIKGAQYVRDYLSPNQSVVYNEAHDNYTMFDKLKGSLPATTSDSELAQRHALGTGTQYLANGAVFIHAGQEFLRTKAGDHNSYKSPDSVNVFDYDRAQKYKKEVKFFRDLNQFRKQYDFMRQGSYDEVNKKYTHEIISGEETIATNHVGYTVKSAFPVKTKSGKDSADAFAFVNAGNQAWEAPLPAGEYEVMIKGLDVYQNPVALTSNGKVTVPPLSILLLREAAAPDPAPEPEPNPEPDPNPNPQPQPEPEPQPEPNPNPNPGVEPNPNPGGEPNPGSEPNPNPNPGIVPNPNPSPQNPTPNSKQPNPRPSESKSASPAGKKPSDKGKESAPRVRRQGLGQTGAGVPEMIMVSLLLSACGVTVKRRAQKRS